MSAKGDVTRIDDREVQITHPEKVLFPQDGLTKRDLVAYYISIAPWLLPHLRGRPLAMERYPDGIDRPGFFHKSAPSFYPDWIETVTVERKQGGTTRHVVCNNEATLAYLANQACITPHVWLSRVDRLNVPDQMVFDLDPSGDAFGLVKATAASLKRLLDRLDLPAYLKTSGSRGLHVVVPLKRRENFDSVRTVARQLAMIVAGEAPRQRTLEQRKDMRGGRVYLDINRNAYAQTIASVLTVRARPGAPVSAPLSWSELGRKDLRPDGVTVRTIIRRLERGSDPWGDFWQRAISLGRARRKLENLYAARSLSPQAELRGHT
jgi:bifunctional non-homologous end joining protein LigD